MSHSFTFSPKRIPPRTSKPVVLVTGASGNIGTHFAEHADQKYSLRLMVQEIDEKAERIRSRGELVTGDLADLDGLKKLCDGVDTVVHLAANPSPSAAWASVRDDNITGTYHTFVAAKAAGVRRIIYASSIHAVSGYPEDVQVKTSEPVNPGDLYGVSKCFGEALGRYLAEQEGVSVICLRIGAFQPVKNMQDPEKLSLLDAWVSHRDLQQLIEKCIDDERLQFAIFMGLSNNAFKRLDISDARELVGYQPQDDFTAVNPATAPLKLAEQNMGHNVKDGGVKSGLREELKK
jgi:UDP-glucose 4-epimerase